MTTMTDLAERADTARQTLTDELANESISAWWEDSIIRLTMAAVLRREEGRQILTAAREAANVVALMVRWAGQSESIAIAGARVESRRCQRVLMSRPDDSAARDADLAAAGRYTDLVLIALAGPWLPILRGEEVT